MGPGQALMSAKVLNQRAVLYPSLVWNRVRLSPWCRRCRRSRLPGGEANFPITPLFGKYATLAACGATWFTAATNSRVLKDTKAQRRTGSVARVTTLKPSVYLVSQYAALRDAHIREPNRQHPVACCVR